MKPPEGLIDWVKKQKLDWHDYIIYRAGWQADPLAGIKHRCVDCVCTHCGTHFKAARADGTPFGFFSPVSGDTVQSGKKLLCPECGALVEMLGYIPEMENVRLWKGKGEFMVQNALPEAFADSVHEFAGETEEEEIRATPLRMGTAVLMQKRGGEIVGVSPRAPALNVRRTTVTPGGVLRQEDEDTGERLYRLSRRPRPDTDSEAEVERWQHLEAVAWCDWDAPEE